MRNVWYAGIAIALCAGACSAPKPTEQGDYVLQDSLTYYQGAKTNELVVHLTSEPPSLHPVNGANAKQMLIRNYLYQSLMTMDLATAQAMPELAAAQPVISADGKTYTYTIDELAKWNDGTPITAQDILFSVKAVLSPLTQNAEYRSVLDAIEDVLLDAKNPRSIAFRMKEKYVLNDYVVTSIKIIDERVFDPNHALAKFSVKDFCQKNTAEKAAKDKSLKAWAETFNSAEFAVKPENMKGGSGAYMVANWTAGQQIVLERNPHYWGKGKKSAWHHQYPDKLIFTFIADDKATEMSIKQQAIDVSTQLSTESYLALLESEVAQTHYHIGTQTRDGFAWVLFNTKPQANKRAASLAETSVRQALAQAVPVQQLMDAVYGGLATRTAQPMSTAHPDYNKALQPLAFDTTAAKKRLEAAGWKDSDGNGVRDKMIGGKKTELTFTLLYPAGKQTVEDIATRMREIWQKIGVKCTAEPLELAKISPRLAKHDFDACMISASMPPTPYDFKQMWHSTNWAKGSNFTGFGDAETDKLIDRARAELNPAERKKINDQITQRIYEQQPCIFLFNLPVKYAIHRRFNHAQCFSVPDFIYLNDLQMIPYKAKE